MKNVMTAELFGDEAGAKGSRDVPLPSVATIASIRVGSTLPKVHTVYVTRYGS